MCILLLRTCVGCCLSPHLIESYTMHGVTVGDESANYIGTGDILRSRVSFVDYNVASEWINKCADHEFCQKQEEVVLPTRVIDCFQPENRRFSSRMVFTDSTQRSAMSGEEDSLSVRLRRMLTPTSEESMFRFLKPS